MNDKVVPAAGMQMSRQMFGVDRLEMGMLERVKMQHLEVKEWQTGEVRTLLSKRQSCEILSSMKMIVSGNVGNMQP